MAKAPGLARRRIDRHDPRAVLFPAEPVLARIAVGADADIEARSIGRGGKALRPVIVDGPRRQLGHLGPLSRDLGSAVLVIESQQRVGVGDVELVADQRHAEGRVQPLQEHALGLGHAIAIRVTQQHDAVRARHARAGAIHGPDHDLSPDPAHHATASRRLFLLRRVGLGDEHIAVRQDVEPARMIEPGGVGADREPVGGLGRLALLPASCLGDVERRDEPLFRRGQGGIGTLRRLLGQFGAVAAARQQKHERRRRNSVSVRSFDACRPGPVPA